MFHDQLMPLVAIVFPKESLGIPVSDKEFREMMRKFYGDQLLTNKTGDILAETPAQVTHESYIIY